MINNVKIFDFSNHYTIVTLNYKPVYYNRIIIIKDKAHISPIYRSEYYNNKIKKHLIYI